MCIHTVKARCRTGPRLLRRLFLPLEAKQLPLLALRFQALLQYYRTDSGSPQRPLLTLFDRVAQKDRESLSICR
jgi:hypothetical protein